MDSDRPAQTVPPPIFATPSHSVANAIGTSVTTGAAIGQRRDGGAVAPVRSAKRAVVRRVASLGSNSGLPRPARNMSTLTPTRTTPVARGTKTALRSNAEPLFQKGLWYQRQGQIEQAVAMYEDALSIAPHHSAAGAALLSATLETDAFEKACVLGEQLHSRNPEDRRIALNLAVALVGCARPREAIKLLDQQAGLPQPRLFEICFHKGVAYGQIGEQQQAVEWYRKAEAIHPRHSRLLFNLALAFEKQSDYAEAVRYYHKYLAIPPTSETRMRERVIKRVALLEEGLATQSDARRTTP